MLPQPREPRWITPLALLLAAAVHLLFILIFRVPAPGATHGTEQFFVVLPNPTTDQGERMVEPAAPSAAGQAAPAVTPLREPARIPTEIPKPSVAQPGIRVTAPTPVATAGEGAGKGNGGKGAQTSVADRLLPRATDARIWGPVIATGEAPDPVKAALAPLYGQIAAFNDSLRLAGDAAARATDWTVKDGNGGRWGVSPGEIHLGKVTLPLPFGFSTPPGRRDELSGRLSTWNAIQRQAGQVEASESFKERAKAIRDRKAAERDSTKAAAKKTGGSGG